MSHSRRRMNLGRAHQRGAAKGKKSAGGGSLTARARPSVIEINPKKARRRGVSNSRSLARAPQLIPLRYSRCSSDNTSPPRYYFLSASVTETEIDLSKLKMFFRRQTHGQSPVTIATAALLRWLDGDVPRVEGTTGDPFFPRARTGAPKMAACLAGKTTAEGSARH